MTRPEPGQCQHASREDIPWYVNGTLPDSESLRLKAHLDTCADCRADLEWHTRMRTGVLGRKLTPIVPATRSADILAREEHSGRSHTRSRRVSSL
ncbi:MAG: zf-HC2 domain-containing protein, partial [Gammaproteobacteria bacterium]|nr:zf-HC2 domain-containing protein [Gammaproteobacteria bacterium]